jgi:hypothetical protein
MKHLALMFTVMLATASSAVLADDMKKDAMDDAMMDEKTMHDDDMMKDDDGMGSDTAMSSDTKRDDDHGSSSIKDDGMMDDDMKNDSMNDH